MQLNTGPHRCGHIPVGPPPSALLGSRGLAGAGKVRWWAGRSTLYKVTGVPFTVVFIGTL